MTMFKHQLFYISQNSCLRKYFRLINLPNINFFLIAHPNSGSIKSIKDLFLSFGYKSIVANIKVTQIKEIPLPFIAQLINPEELVIVERIDNNFIYSDSKGRKKVLFDLFIKRWLGIVIIFDFENKKSSSIQWRSSLINLRIIRLKYYFIPVFIILLIFFLQFFVVDICLSFILVFFILSFISSYLLLEHEYNFKNFLMSRICNSHKIFDCQRILNSNISSMFRFTSLAKLSFFTFSFLLFLVTNSLIMGLDFQLAISFVFMFLLIVSPLSIFLLCYQLFIIRKLCPLCVFIQLSIIVCSIYYILSSNIQLITFSIYNLPIILYSLLLGFVLTKLTTLYYSKAELKRDSLLYYKTTKKIEIIELLINQSTLLKHENYGITFISRNGTSNVNFVLSLTCHYCKEAFFEYKHILETIPKVGLRISLIASDIEFNEIGGFICRILSLYKTGNSSWYELLEKWYIDPQFRKKNSFLISDSELLKESLRWTKINELRSTPSYIIDNRFWHDDLSIIDLSDYLRVKYS